jgi:hypothetical protein
MHAKELLQVETPKIDRLMHSVRNGLLSGISAVTIAAIVGGPALAADAVYDVPALPTAETAAAMTEGWVSLEGRFNIFANNPFDLRNTNFSFYGPVDPSPDTGWGGTIELGVKPANMDYDFVGRFAYLRSEGDANSQYLDLSYPYYDKESVSDVTQDLMLADFEVGRELGVGTRVHAGLRFAHFDARRNGDGYAYSSYSFYGSYSASFADKSTFTGIGPRVGIDQRMGLTDTLSLDLSAAAAALYGKRKGEIDADSDFYGSYSGSISENKWLFNGEASAGVTYSKGNTSITTGYRVDYLQDISVHYLSGSEGDYFSHGPFLKATFKFGG